MHAFIHSLFKTEKNAQMMKALLQKNIVRKTTVRKTIVRKTIVRKTIVRKDIAWKAITSCILSLCLIFLSAVVHAGQIDGIRMWSSPEGTRLVFDISAPLEHQVFVLSNPDRIVVDFKNTSFSRGLPHLDFSGSHLRGIRSAKRNQHDLRVVLDAKIALKPKSFLLKPMGDYGNRLVLDLDEPQSASQAQTPKKTLQGLKDSVRPVIVAIDAGHGGEDPGAIGKHKTREKDVVLSIAKKLYRLLEKEQGIQPVLIREGDYYISLRGRIRKARAHKADLFVSVHADAAKNRRANGASVFVLSQKGASSEAARWLAATQNKSDLIGGVSLDDKDDLLASVLLDLSQNATIAASTGVGESILRQLGFVSNLHKGLVERAGFVVLKSPDIPSILVETGFISNVKEERKLKKRNHQEDIARAVLAGVTSYFRQNPPAGTFYAMLSQQKADISHVIRKGETISTIAQRYNVSLAILRQINRLDGDLVFPGQVIRIPRADNS
jgi:N-acetylmuramoyl-L-alanine amidase